MQNIGRHGVVGTQRHTPKAPGLACRNPAFRTAPKKRNLQVIMAIYNHGNKLTTEAKTMQFIQNIRTRRVYHVRVCSHRLKDTHAFVYAECTKPFQ